MSERNGAAVLTEDELIRAAMGVLGRRTSEKKKASSRANGARTQFKARALSELACTCGQCPENPKTTCPRGRAIRRRQTVGQPREGAST